MYFAQKNGICFCCFTDKTFFCDFLRYLALFGGNTKFMYVKIEK